MFSRQVQFYFFYRYPKKGPSLREASNTPCPTPQREAGEERPEPPSPTSSPTTLPDSREKSARSAKGGSKRIHPPEPPLHTPEGSVASATPIQSHNPSAPRKAQTAGAKGYTSAFKPPPPKAPSMRLRAGSTGVLDETRPTTTENFQTLNPPAPARAPSPAT